jgi:hypothetical protein
VRHVQQCAAGPAFGVVQRQCQGGGMKPNKPAGRCGVERHVGNASACAVPCSSSKCAHRLVSGGSSFM